MANHTPDQKRFLNAIANKTPMRYNFPTDRATTKSERRRERQALGFVLVAVAAIAYLIYLNL